MSNEIELFVEVTSAWTGYPAWNVPRELSNVIFSLVPVYCAKNLGVIVMAWFFVGVGAVISNWSVMTFSWFGVRDPAPENAVRFLVDLKVDDVATCEGLEGTRCCDTNGGRLRYIFGWCKTVANLPGNPTELCRCAPAGAPGHTNVNPPNFLCG